MAFINFQPSDYFNTKLYTGNNTSTNAITGVGFQPDFLWIKPRNMANDHRLHSSLLTGSDYFLHANATNAEQQFSNSVTSFDTDGFTLGTSDPGWNGNYNYVSWNWKANGAGSTNTDGSISSTVSANTTSGFSIVKWTGSGADGTIGHGLGVAPKMVIVKSLANTTNWMVYHASLGNAKEIYLNGTSASAASTAWNSTTPTSSVISLDGGGGNGVNASGDYVAYCFAEKKGFSKFGSYKSNNSTDGVFIYTGFKPAFVLCKVTDTTTNDWTLLDSARDTYNVAGKRLYPNLSGTESEVARADFLSNGFKLRGTGSDMNGSGNTYIYMAFAEEPLVSSNDIPATAR